MVIEAFHEVLLGHYCNDKNGRVLDLDKHSEVLDAVSATISLLIDHDDLQKDIWPRNLILDVGIIPLNEYLTDLSLNLSIALNTINDDYAQVLFIHYKGGKSIRECSKELLISESVVRKRIKAGLDLLKRKERIRLICAGVRLTKTSQQLEQEIIDDIKRMKSQLQERHPVTNSDDIDNSDIYILGLSNRLFLALRRHGINSMSDLRKMTRERLCTIQGLGRKSVDEIYDKAFLYGIIIQDHDEMIR